MQNIPSHATDIRHMFRATPEITEQLQVKEDDTNTVQFKLSRYDTISTNEGPTKVKDLTEGSIVILKEGANNIEFVVSHIEFVLGEANIILTEKGE